MHHNFQLSEPVMILIEALPAFTDNYLWLLQDPVSQRCAVVDPGDAAPVLAWLSAHPGWQLSDILITWGRRGKPFPAAMWPSRMAI